MKWNILGKLKTKSEEIKAEEIVKLFLENRGLKTRSEVEDFLNPKNPSDYVARDLGIDEKEVKKAVNRIKEAIANNEAIVVYGDYDADGICATAILWETLYKLTKNVLPHIPERVSEGYGLNKESIKNLIRRFGGKNLRLIITVDHGITAAEKIKYAKTLGIDVIVCDHHQLGKEKPKCLALLHTERVCAATIAWFLSRELTKTTDYRLQAAAVDSRQSTIDYSDLVAIATIADLVPLVGVNRSFTKYGLAALNKTKRCGLLAIFEEAGIKQGEIGTYEVGYLIAPRLNAMGRMEHALESLRLVCTPKVEKAKELASKLGMTNRERQLLTEETTRHAVESSKFIPPSAGQSSKLIFISNETYNQGIIGLVAGKLVEEFYRPAIVISKGEVYSKASARSINGFNIIEAIRAQNDLLIDAGGHPMAAGFTIETAKIETFRERLREIAEAKIVPEMLEKTLKIDMELPLSSLSLELWSAIHRMAPFGLGNPEPVLVSKVMIRDVRTVGSKGKHLKLILGGCQSDKVSKFQRISAIGFGLGHLLNQLQFDQTIMVAYNLALNEWNGEKKIELKIRDIKWMD